MGESFEASFKNSNLAREKHLHDSAFKDAVLVFDNGGEDDDARVLAAAQCTMP